jgi:hypothetical protein
MGSRRESIVGRARWIAAFALLLLACLAVPVFAAEPVEDPPSEPAGFTPPTPKEEEVAAAQVPNASEISNAIGEAEREEAKQEEVDLSSLGNSRLKELSNSRSSLLYWPPRGSPAVAFWQCGKKECRLPASVGIDAETEARPPGSGVSSVRG